MAGGGAGGASAGAAGNAGAAGAVVDPPFDVTVSTSSKLDLLLMIDNSVSMGDKQHLLGQSIPALLDALLNPVCVDPATGLEHPELTPIASNEACPAGYERQFYALSDVHIGIITSSMGSQGSDACINSPERPQKEDMAHLLGSLPRGAAALPGAAGVNALGFLEWQGTADVTQSFLSLISTTGEAGCGFEASLEAWYRFLVDPEPYLQLVPGSCTSTGTDTNCRTPSGIDQALLDQRHAFLRDDSLVTVMMLTDENDCSVKASGQAWYVVDLGADSPMWRATSICETDPNSPCCYSCGQAPPAGCAQPDPEGICGSPTDTREPNDHYVDEQGRKSVLDQDNLRCWHQKQRFGVDFLYPVERYANALTQSQLCLTRNDLDTAQCGAGVVVPNPLYPTDTAGALTLRNPSMVFLMGILGVPWQDLAEDPTDTTQLTYQSLATMNERGTWDIILGDGLNPSDPLMLESITPRATLSPPTAGYLENPVNGHEWQPNPPNDLQYACVFPMAAPLDCAALAAVGDPRNCECDGPASTAEAQQSKPLCQSPDGLYGTTQYLDKAYPGIRPLQVLKQFGDVTGNAVVSSICSRNVSDYARQDYAYRPAMTALMRLIKGHIEPYLPQ